MVVDEAKPKKKFSRPTGILMGDEGSGKTTALATAFQRYLFLLTDLDNLEGFESCMEDISPKLVVPPKKIIPGGNRWAWFHRHRMMVAACMRRRATSKDPKVRKTLAGEIAPKFRILDEDAVPGIVVSEFSALLFNAHEWREKKYPEEGWKSYDVVKVEALEYMKIFNRYGLGMWWEMHVEEADPKKTGSVRGPACPGTKMKRALLRAARNIWEIEYTYDYGEDADDDDAEQRYVMTRPSDDTRRKTRIKTPARLDLKKHTMAYYIRKAGIPVN